MKQATKTEPVQDIPTAAAIAADTMKGDMRDLVLDRIKNLKKPWQQMPEHEQKNLVWDIERAVEAAITQAVEIIAADKRPVIKATLEKCTVKDGIDATLKLSKHDPQRHSLIDATGATVMIAFANANAFMGKREDAKTDADQPTIFDKTDQGADAARDPVAA